MPDLRPDETQDYEAPAIVSLGAIDDLTRGEIDGSVTTTAIQSDRLLKHEIEPLENALARLRSVQPR